MEKVTLIKSYDRHLLEQIRREKAKKIQAETLGNPTKPPAFDQLAAALDEYYIFQLLKNYCAYLNYKQVVHPQMIPYDRSVFPLIDPVINLVDSATDVAPPIQLYNQIRTLFDERLPQYQAEKCYAEALELIRSNKILDKDILMETLSMLSNFCIFQINKHNNDDYIEKLFVINNEILRIQYVGNSSKRLYIPASLFKNMVVTAYKIKSPQLFENLHTEGLDSNNNITNAHHWASSFVGAYKNRIPKTDRKKYVSYCLAYISFREKRIHEAYKQLINPLRLRGLFINMDIRLLHLQILFELQLHDPDQLDKDDISIHKYCGSLRHLIAYDKNKKKQVAYQIDHYINFEKNYRELIRIYFRYNQPYMSKDEKYLQQMDRFAQQIADCPYSFKAWFMEKWKEMKKR